LDDLEPDDFYDYLDADDFYDYLDADYLDFAFSSSES